MGVVGLFLGLPTLDGSPGPGAESCPPTPPPCPVCRPLNATLMAGGHPGLIAKLRLKRTARTFPRLHGYLKSECNSPSRGGSRYRKQRCCTGHILHGKEIPPAQPGNLEQGYADNLWLSLPSCEVGLMVMLDSGLSHEGDCLEKASCRAWPALRAAQVGWEGAALSVLASLTQGGASTGGGGTDRMIARCPQTSKEEQNWHCALEGIKKALFLGDLP